MTTGPTHALLVQVCNEIDQHPRCPACDGAAAVDLDDEDEYAACEVCDGSGLGSAWLPDLWRPLRLAREGFDDRPFLVVDPEDAPRHQPASSPFNDATRAAYAAAIDSFEDSLNMSSLMRRAGEAWLSMAADVYVEPSRALSSDTIWRPMPYVREEPSDG